MYASTQVAVWYYVIYFTGGRAVPSPSRPLDCTHNTVICPTGMVLYFFWKRGKAIGWIRMYDAIQVRLWSAWKCVQRVEGPSHSGIPTLSF